MAWVRRTRHLALVALSDGPEPAITARSYLTGAVEELSLADLAELTSCSARSWAWRTDETAVSLAARGLLVSDEPLEPFESLRRRDAELTALGWHPAAAAFHLATWWDGYRVSAPGRDGSPPLRSARVGEPESPFYERGGERVRLRGGRARR